MDLEELATRLRLARLDVEEAKRVRDEADAAYEAAEKAVHHAHARFDQARKDLYDAALGRDADCPSSPLS
jgi:exonuclease VII small subunit